MKDLKFVINYYILGDIIFKNHKSNKGATRDDSYHLACNLDGISNQMTIPHHSIIIIDFVFRVCLVHKNLDIF